LRIAASPLAAASGWSHWRGPAAYQLLLEIACGLKSAVPGEPHVFGQIKSAWQAFSQNQQGARALRPTIQALFADTKRIRTAFLQGIGRQSYGRLANALIKPTSGDRILIVGAGDMGREIASIFNGYPLAVWARREPAGLNQAYRRYLPGAERSALGWADHVIFCTPPLADLDRSWAQAAYGQQLKTLLHLGYHRVPQPWAQQADFRTLHDLLRLKRARANVTSLKLQQARRACHSAARVRAARLPGKLREAAG
jgi:glutamyl-tRNA reductase